MACGIPIPDWAGQSWPRWFAPERAPFLVDELPVEDRERLPAVTSPEVPLELRDTFWIYGADRDRIWLDQDQFEGLPKGLRQRLLRAQRDEHEVWLRGPSGSYGPWWPTLIPADLAPIVAYLEFGCPPSTHGQVAESTWSAVAPLLPRARELAGTFAPGSGPNCFGTVLAAAGVADADETWMGRQEVEDWLSERTTPVDGPARDHEPGTVLSWRDADGSLQHASVTLGDGWALNKPSQAWASPRFVWTVDQVKRHTRQSGLRLSRRQLRQATRPGDTRVHSR